MELLLFETGAAEHTLDEKGQGWGQLPNSIKARGILHARAVQVLPGCAGREGITPRASPAICLCL